MKTLSPDDPIRARARKTVAARHVGVGAKCSQCGESRPEALIATRTPMICAECDRLQHGQSPIDRHHVAGKANSPVTIAFPANDHRAELSEAQRHWPADTLRNPDGSPLLAAAAWIRGFIDTVVHLIEKGLTVAAELLEKLNAFLRQKLGAEWWRGTPFEKFAPKRNP